MLEDADATLDPVVSNESPVAVDPILTASLWPAGTPLYLTEQEVSKAVSVFGLDETAWQNVLVHRSWEPVYGMLWTGSTMASSTPPVPPKSARYLSVWSYGHAAPRPTGSGRPLEFCVDASHDGWAASASGAASAAAAGAPWPVSW